MVESRYVYHLGSSVLTIHLPIFLGGLRMKKVNVYVRPQPVGEELTSMNEQDNRPLLRFTKFPTLRFDNPSLHILIICTLEPEFLALAQSFVFQI